LGHARNIFTAFAFLQTGQVVGIGSGTTIVYAVDRIGKMGTLHLYWK